MRRFFQIAVLFSGIVGNAGLAKAGVTCPLVVAGDFPVTYVDHRIPVITIKIGGVALTMLVDSGASSSSITDAAWERLGGPPFRTLNGSYVTGFGGTVQLNTGLLEDVDTGHAVAKDQAFIVTDNGVFPNADHKTLADGVLGYDFLDNFDVGLDFPDNRLSLYFYQHCDSPQAPWQGDYDQEALTFHRDGLDSTIPYGIDDQTLQGVIDTGSYSTIVFQSALDRLGIRPSATPANFTGQGLGVGDRKFSYRIEKFDSITIGAEQFGNAWVRVAATPASEFSDLALGEDYLSTHRVFISSSTQTVLLGLYAAK